MKAYEFGEQGQRTPTHFEFGLIFDTGVFNGDVRWVETIPINSNSFDKMKEKLLESINIDIIDAASDAEFEFDECDHHQQKIFIDAQEDSESKLDTVKASIDIDGLKKISSIFINEVNIPPNVSDGSKDDWL